MTVDQNSQEYAELRVPVSVKGILLHNDFVLLRHNDRHEWELPGGKLELGESPEQCVAREIAEETGLNVKVGNLVDAWVYTIFEGRHVLILTYACDVSLVPDELISPEGDRIEFIPMSDIQGIEMPVGYKRSILTAQRAPD